MNEHSALLHSAFSPTARITLKPRQPPPPSKDAEALAFGTLICALHRLDEYEDYRELPQSYRDVLLQSSDVLLRHILENPHSQDLPLYWARLYRELPLEILSIYGIHFEEMSEVTHKGPENTVTCIEPVKIIGHNGTAAIGTSCEYAYIKHCFGHQYVGHTPISTSWVEVGDEIHQTHKIQLPNGEQQTIWFHSAPYAGLSLSGFKLFPNRTIRRPAHYHFESDRVYMVADQARSKEHVQHVYAHMATWHLSIPKLG